MVSVLIIRDWGIFGTHPQWICWFSFLWKESSSPKLQLLYDAKKCTVSVDNWEICFEKPLLLWYGLTGSPPNGTKLSLDLPSTATVMLEKHYFMYNITEGLDSHIPMLGDGSPSHQGLHVPLLGHATFILAFPEQIFWKPSIIFVCVIKHICTIPQ